MELLREGRKLRILRASLAGTSGVSAIATLVYLKPTRSPSVERSLAGSSERFPEHLPRYRSKSPYFTLVDCRPEAGGFGEAGPGAAWMRMEGDILAGQSVAPLAFAALVADTGSGLSASLPRTHWIYPNVTLSLHLSRRVAPGWLHISAHTRDCKEGVAQVDTVIRDMRGEVARAHQSLYIEQRDVPDARP
jgi:hypothetical protein